MKRELKVLLRATSLPSGVIARLIPMKRELKENASQLG